MPRMYCMSPRRTTAICFASLVAWFIYLTEPTEPKLLLTRLNQISLGVEQRVTWWNWQDTEEEIYCRNLNASSYAATADVSRPPIPNVVHYIFLRPHGVPAEIKYRDFISIKSTLLRMRPDEVKIHTFGLEETNPWWQRIRDHVTLVDHDRSQMTGPHGRPLDDFHPAHQADFLRLSILDSEGGIYFDNDVFAFKPFTDLLENPRDIILGHEGGNRYGFGNGIIIARPGSEFLKKWIASYATFNRWIWNYHSIRMPKLLQVEHPELICPLSPTAFFWPTWAGKHSRYMHSRITEAEKREVQRNMTDFGGAMYENQLALHRGVALSPGSMLEEDTRFNVLFRDLDSAPL